jgi:hypothetical protein
MELEPDETCSGCLADELKPENVAPLHEDARLFVDSQWTAGGRLSAAYVVYRVVVSVLVVAWVVADLLNEAGRWYSYSYVIWFVFATNWAMIILCASTVWMAVSSLYYYCRQRRSQGLMDYPKPIGWGLRLQWVVYNIASNSSLVVSISYWAFILIFVNNDLSDFMTTPMSQLKHSLNTIYVVIDLFVNAIPVRIYHMIYPLFAGVVYAIFNAVYFTNHGRGPNGHPYAYDVMDWRNPLGSTVTCLLGFVLSAVVHFLLYGLYRARLVAHRRLNALLAAETGGAATAPAGPYRAAANDEDIFAATADDAESGPIFPPKNRRRGPAGGLRETTAEVADGRGRTNVGYRSIESLELNGR